MEICFPPQRRALFRPLDFQKWSEREVFLPFFTYKCASRHNGAHFFDLSTSNSGPNVRCFYLFYLQMCFPPQRRALFDISTSKSGPNVRCYYLFYLQCASRDNGVHFFDISTSKFSEAEVLCASHHTGVQLFISHLARWLRTRRFSEVNFRPSGATNHWKNTMNRDFPTFSRTCIFFLLTFSPLWSSHFFSSPLWLFPPLLFHLSILSEVWLLNFLRIFENDLDYISFWSAGAATPPRPPSNFHRHRSVVSAMISNGPGRHHWQQSAASPLWCNLRWGNVTPSTARP